MVRSVPNRNLNIADPVAEAELFIGQLIKGETAGGRRKNAAIETIARRAHVPSAFIRSLKQPSRRPKGIDQRWWSRLRNAYLDWLSEQLAALEAEKQRVEALGSADGAVQDLVDKTETLLDDLKDLKRLLRPAERNQTNSEGAMG